jgi:hypothetical protein
MVLFLYPAALILAMTGDMSIAISQIPEPVVEASQPTFDPNVPPAWWTDKMRQPCSKSGDRVVC